MKILSNQLHGILDYATVLLYLSAPSVVALTGLAAMLSYALAGVHLAMTVLTNMPMGIIKIIPMRIHAIVEMLVGPTLIAVAFATPGFSAHAKIFFAAAGVAICLVWLLSEYASVKTDS